MSTHAVTNQVPPLSGHSLLTSDPALEEGLRRWSGTTAYEDIAVLGELAGRPEAQRAGDQANTYTPVLRTHAPTGERLDEVEFHPAWHQLMDVAVSHGLTASPWTEPVGTGAHVRRAVGFIIWSQVEAGHLCPVSMTYAAVPALRANPDLAAAWVPKLASREYDFGLRPLAGKRGAIAGMGMTEKQGGSDVRANTTVATVADGGPLAGGETYRLTGHKWFLSAPMSDAFLVLAQTGAGPTCFLVPRVLDDGSPTPSRCNGSRTSWATAPTPPPRSSSTTPGACASATRAVACARSSTWSPRRGSTACSARPPPCARPSPGPFTTPGTAPPSAPASSTSP